MSERIYVCLGVVAVVLVLVWIAVVAAAALMPDDEWDDDAGKGD